MILIRFTCHTITTARRVSSCQHTPSKPPWNDVGPSFLHVTCNSISHHAPSLITPIGHDHIPIRRHNTFVWLLEYILLSCERMLAYVGMQYAILRVLLVYLWKPDIYYLECNNELYIK